VHLYRFTGNINTESVFVKHLFLKLKIKTVNADVLFLMDCF